MIRRRPARPRCGGRFHRVAHALRRRRTAGGGAAPARRRAAGSPKSSSRCSAPARRSGRPTARRRWRRIPPIGDSQGDDRRPSGFRTTPRVAISAIDSLIMRAWSSPAADRRAARDAGGGGVTVDICAACGPGLPTDPAYLADALRPTAWLQSDHLDQGDRRAGRTEAVPRFAGWSSWSRGAPLLGAIDFSGHYSAVDTMRRRAGDCTEAAVMLAASAGRRASRPGSSTAWSTRLRYHGVSNAFMPHSWTVAYVDGNGGASIARWTSNQPYRDDRRRRRCALDPGREPARGPAALGRDARSACSPLRQTNRAGAAWRTMVQCRHP